MDDSRGVIVIGVETVAVGSKLVIGVTGGARVGSFPKLAGMTSSAEPMLPRVAAGRAFRGRSAGKSSSCARSLLPSGAISGSGSS